MFYRPCFLWLCAAVRLPSQWINCCWRLRVQTGTDNGVARCSPRKGHDLLNGNLRITSVQRNAAKSTHTAAEETPCRPNRTDKIRKKNGSSVSFSRLWCLPCCVACIQWLFGHFIAELCTYDRWQYNATTCAQANWTILRTWKHVLQQYKTKCPEKLH